MEQMSQRRVNALARDPSIGGAKMFSFYQKKCSTCGEVKSVSEFGKNKDHTDGLTSNCKDCRTAVVLRWKKNNPEKDRAINARYRENHPEKEQERKRRWHEGNMESYRESCRRRRARLKGNGGKITKEEWQAVLDKYGCRCLYPGCNRTDIQMDHVVPLALGGTHTMDNVQPLCRFHNISKKDKFADYR